MKGSGISHTLNIAFYTLNKKEPKALQRIKQNADYTQQSEQNFQFTVISLSWLTGKKLHLFEDTLRIKGEWTYVSYFCDGQGGRQ